jgi:hypothetical protein
MPATLDRVRLPIISLLFIAGAASAISGCGGPSKITLVVPDGREVVYKTTSRVQRTGALAQNTSYEMGLDWLMTFNTRPDGGYSVKIKADRFTLNGQVGPEASSRLRKAVEDVDLTLVVLPDGKVAAWSEPEASAATDQDTVRSLTATLRTMGPLGTPLPKEALSTGLKWKSEFDLVQLLPSSLADGAEGSLSIEYVFAGFESISGRSAARIAYSGAGSLSRAVTVAGAKVDADGKITSSGTAWIDARTGLMLKHSWKGSTTLSAGGIDVAQEDSGESVLASAPE